MSFTADFELGSNGSDILAADPGSLTAWSFVIAGTFNTSTYDNSTSAGGSQCAKLANSGGVAGNMMAWSTTTQTDYYGRIYLKAGGFPEAGNWLLLRAHEVDINGAPCWDLYLTVGGIFVVRDSLNVAIYTSTAAASNGSWIRFEYHVVHGSGDIEIKLFNSPYSTTPTETSSIASGQSLLPNAVAIRHNNSMLNTTHRFDEIVAWATSYPGPFVDTSGTTSLPMGMLGTGGRWG